MQTLTTKTPTPVFDDNMAAGGIMQQKLGDQFGTKFHALKGRLICTV